MGFPLVRGRRVQSLVSASLVVALLSMLAATALLGARPAAAQDDDAFLTATVAPEDALAYVAFTLDDESEQWTQAAELLERAGLGPALEQVRQDLLADANADALPLDAFLGGQGAFIITSPALDAAAEAAGGLTGGLSGDLGLEETPAAADAAPEPTGVAFVLDARAPDTAFLGLAGALEDQATAAGAQVVESTYEGVEIRFAPADPGGDGTDLALARLDNDLILLGGAPADLEPVIDASAGSIPALADAAPFAQVRAALAGDFLLYGFVNGVAIAEAQTAEGGDPLGLGTAGTEITGLDQYTGVLVRSDPLGFRMETVNIAGEGSQLPPSAPNFDSELLQRAPGEALFFLNATELGQTGVLDALGLIAILAASGFTGGPVATPTAGTSQEEFIAQQYEQAASLLGFNIQTDLFRQFIGEYAIWVTSGPDLTTTSALFVSGVADPGTVVNALSQLTLLVQGAGGGETTVTTRQVDGSEVNVVDVADPAAPDVEYGVVGQQLLLGLGEAIDAFVTGPDEALADNDQYQEVMAALPPEHNGQLYVDLAQIIPLLQTAQAADEDGDEFAVEDASEECGQYATQEEAQAAYDEDPFGNSALDQDFDGEACEDFFAAPAEATPAADGADAAADSDYSAVKAFALVSFEEDATRRTSSILYIEE
jgi:Protein of unknown function (DUF3352)